VIASRFYATEQIVLVYHNPLIETIYHVYVISQIEIELAILLKQEGWQRVGMGRV